MQSDSFIHVFQSTTFTVGEFEEPSERLNTYLQGQINKLNSNQAFEADDNVHTHPVHGSKANALNER